MDIRRHNRITALLLALVMLLPLISIPAFAEEAEAGAELLWKESFDGKTLGDVATAYPATSQIKAADKDADAHGDVLQIDVKGVGATEYYLWQDQNHSWPLTNVTVADGIVTGDANGATWSGAINSETASPSVKVSAKNGEATEEAYYVVTGAYADAVGGKINVGQPAHFRNPAVSSEDVATLALTMDLYFAPGTKTDSGISARMSAVTASGNQNVELFEIMAYGTYVTFKPHENGAYVGTSESFNVPTGTWVTLTILIDTATAVRTVYVNGEFVSQMTNRTPLNTAVSPRASQLQFQIDRGSIPGNLDGYVQVDNVAMTAGDLMELPAFENTYYYADFEMHEGVSQENFQKYYLSNGVGNYLASSARPYTEANGNTAMKMDFLWGTDNAGNNNVPHNLPIPALSYKETEKIYMEVKYYIEPNSKGTIENQFYCFLNNGTSASWINLFRIDSSNGSLMATGLVNSGSYLTIGEWNTVGVIFNLVNGDVELYLNGMYAATQNCGKTNVTLCRNADNPVSTGGWIVAKVLTNKTPSPETLAGSFMVDDCRMMTLDALPAEYGYLYYNSFGTTKNDTQPSNGVSAIAVSGSKVTNKYSSNAWAVDFKVQSKSAAMEGDLNRDLNPLFKVPALSYTTTPSIVIETDYFIETDARGQIQSQIRTLTHDGATVNPDTGKTDNTYVDLYVINFADPKGGATIQCEGGAQYGTAKLSLGAWNTVSVVIDMVKAMKKIYLNGELVADTNLKPAYSYWTNIAFDEGKLVVGKANKVVGEGTFHVDNIKVFEGTAPSVTPVESNVTDFSEFDRVLGESVLGGTGFINVPALATYASVDGDIAARLGIGPARSYEDYALVAKGPKVKWDLTWDPENPLTGTIGETEYTFTEADGKYTTVIDDVTYYVTTAGEAELIYNDTNVGSPLKAVHGSISYDTSKYAVLEANYYIEEGSKGIIESQGEGFYSGTSKVSYTNLFEINLSNGRLDNSGLYLEIGAWNKVTVVIELASGSLTLYGNGVWAKTKTVKTNLTTAENTWSVAKIKRQSGSVPNPTIYSGGLLVDDISVYALDTAPMSSVGDRFLSDADLNAYADALLEGVNGASIRLSDPTGLRFATCVDTDRLAYLETLFGEGCVAKMGTLIAPASYLDPANERGNTNGVFTKAALEALPYTSKYVDVAFDNVYFSGDAALNTEDGAYMVGSIVNFKEGNIAREFVGAGYVTISVGDFEYTVYGETCTRSAKQVAQAALADESIDWDALGYKDLLTAYATYGE